MHNTHRDALPPPFSAPPGTPGQETLDRVLAHPELELVALGSDSLAGQPASALDPRLNGGVPAFVSNAEALAARRGARLLVPRPRAGGRARAAPADARRRRPLGRAPARGALALPEWYGFEHPHAESLGDWDYAIPELFPPHGPLIANPGCYATAVLLALAPCRSIDPSGGDRRRQVGRLGCGAGAEGRVARGDGARERLALQDRLAPARARDRAGARLPGLLRPASAARPPWPDRDVLRQAAPTACARRSRPPTRRRRP